MWLLHSRYVIIDSRVHSNTFTHVSPFYTDKTPRSSTTMKSNQAVMIYCFATGILTTIIICLHHNHYHRHSDKLFWRLRTPPSHSGVICSVTAMTCATFTTFAPCWLWIKRVIQFQRYYYLFCNDTYHLSSLLIVNQQSWRWGVLFLLRLKLITIIIINDDNDQN